MSNKQRTQPIPPAPKSTLEAGNGVVPSQEDLDMLNKALAEQRTLLIEQRKVTMAQAITLALLCNPSVHNYLGGSPLEPLRRGDLGGHDTVGGYLAAESLRLADDYCDALDALLEARRPTATPSAP